MTPGMDKEICDKTFLRNMLYSCKSFYQAGLGRGVPSEDIYRIVAAFNLPKISFCMAAATTWATAVSAFGKPFFDRNQAEGRLRCDSE